MKTFPQWWLEAPHRQKYQADHPVYLGAKEAWEAARFAWQQAVAYQGDGTRERFEAWCKDRHQDTTRDDREAMPFADGYMNLNTQCFWIGYQAASAERAQVVRLSDEDVHDIMSRTVDCDYQQGLKFARAILAAANGEQK